MTPRLTVAIPSHERPLRLRWLLNALEEQTLNRDAFEVVVCFDDAGEETARLLAEHPLGVRAVRLPAGAGTPRQRNGAWRGGRAPAVLFTDDDCRPPATWLERALAAIERHPGAIVQGTVRPDPDELMLLMRTPHARSLHVDPPTAWGETANIAYPRGLLERLGGFDESYTAAPAGEDTDLLQRALANGARLAGAPELVTYHATHVESLLGRVRTTWRWQIIARVVREHPSLRRDFPLGVFWKERHAKLALGIAGAPLARRAPLLTAALAIPWALAALPRYGRSPRGLARAVSELPGLAVADGAEMAALARGAVRYRTLVL
jgi:glycosyltransferase involved in cell wall biosynthesis